MLTFAPHLRGPLPKLTAPLLAMLESIGCEVVIESWGRHSDDESFRDKVVGRVDDIRRIKRTLIRARPDLMLVHTSHDWKTVVRDVLLLLATRGRRTPTVLQMHGSQPETLLQPGNTVFKTLSRWVVSLSDAVMVLSSEEQSTWRQFYPKGRFYVVTNPFVAPNVHQPGPGSQSPWRQAMRPGVPVLLFVGRLMEKKGIFDLLNALAQLKADTEAHLLIVGDGEEREEIQRQVQQLGLAQRVTLAGYLEGEELHAAYSAAAIFVLPTWFEGFPTVIAEAMHAGLPIVTTPLRGMADHLENGINAVFVPPRDPAAVAEALLRLLTDPLLARRMSEANRNTVRKFAPAVVANGYRHVLNDVLG